MPAWGQLIAYPTGEKFGPEYKFNPDFIAKHRIAEIRLKEEVKRDNERIRPTGLTRVYRFDDRGRTVSTARINNSIGDTLLTFFEYAEGRLECEVHNDASGMFSYCYVYGADGLPTARKYARIGRKYRASGSRPLDRGSDVTTEEYRHKHYPGQLHTTLLNSSGRPYMEETRYYTDSLMTRFLSKYVMSGGRRDERYTYDSDGRMLTKVVPDDNTERRTEYSYDEQGRPAEEKRFVSGVLTERMEYVYHSQTGELTAELQREEKDHQIRITTYSYVYR